MSDVSKTWEAAKQAIHVADLKALSPSVCSGERGGGGGGQREASSLKPREVEALEK